MFQKKVSRRKKDLAIDIAGSIKSRYNGDRVFAELEREEDQKARGYVEGVGKFSEMYPKYGKILKGIIEQKRVARDNYLKFGLKEGSRLTIKDYELVMRDIGLTKNQALALYPSLFDMGKKLQEARNETRSILLP